jgi:hypothetical protein
MSAARHLATRTRQSTKIILQRPEGLENDMFRHFLGAIAATALIVAAGGTVQAAGNLASIPTELELKADTVKLAFSQDKFELETGKYYKLSVSSDGEEELDLKAPDLWENSWINQLEINDVDVFVKGDFHIGFDSEGEADIFFVPLRPGNYQFYADGFQDRGLSATFVVR